ncbi:hypothetical protein G6L32_14760 [Agrobacterium tumefaciens]|nr:hypothetical protein [Agrobacterium tumefaciens]
MSMLNTTAKSTDSKRPADKELVRELTAEEMILISGGARGGCGGCGGWA